MPNVLPWWARLRPAVALAVLFGAASARTASADYIVGGTGNDNTFPFGTTTYYTGEYQQLYASSAFPAPITVNSLGFQSIKVLAPGSETLNLTVGLTTTPASLSAPGASYGANKGPDFTTVFNGPVTFTGLDNGTFDLVIPVTPFTYDPSKGNLLLDVVVNSSSGPGVASFAFGPSASVSRVYNIGGVPGNTTTGVGEGLLTRFGASPVPEPAGLIGFGSGAVLLALGFRPRLGGR